MMEPESGTDSFTETAQKEVLCELREINKSLKSLIEIQVDVKARQRRFWIMAILQMVLILVVIGWWGSRYGF